MTDDKKTFEDVYNHQLEMQVNVYGDGTPLHEFDQNRKVEFLKNNILASLDELHEALAEIGWKPWASSRHINRDAVKGEMVDVLHFFINILGAIEVTPQELIDAYFVKADKNKKRQEDGYDGVSTKCPNCHRALDDDAVGCAIVPPSLYEQGWSLEPGEQVVRCEVTGGVFKLRSAS